MLFFWKKCHFRCAIYPVGKCNLALGLGVCDWEDMRVIRDLEGDKIWQIVVQCRLFVWVTWFLSQRSLKENSIQFIGTSKCAHFIYQSWDFFGNSSRGRWAIFVKLLEELWTFSVAPYILFVQFHWSPLGTVPFSFLYGIYFSFVLLGLNPLNNFFYQWCQLRLMRKRSKWFDPHGFIDWTIYTI